MNRIAAVLAVATLFSAGAIAQDTTLSNQNQSQQKKTFFFSQDGAAKMPMNMTFQGTNDITIMGAEMASPGETVTGVPYTATEVTETTQTLSDGNKIVNKTTGMLLETARAVCGAKCLSAVLGLLMRTITRCFLSAILQLIIMRSWRQATGPILPR